MSARILLLRPHFDPNAPGAEKRYDRIVSKLNRVSAVRLRLRRECAELERQFVENDLEALSGARRGEPLTPHGRRLRLRRLLAANEESRRLDREWAHLHAQLDDMNRALDAWARENWGMGGGE